MMVRIALLSAFAVTMVVLAWHTSALLGAAAAGLALGAALGGVGLRLTRFESNAQGDFYTPNSNAGLWNRVHRISVPCPDHSQSGAQDTGGMARGAAREEACAARRELPANSAIIDRGAWNWLPAGLLCLFGGFLIFVSARFWHSVERFDAPGTTPLQ
jgi:hypothetical protein